MITNVTEAAVRKQEGEYAHQISSLSDLTDAEQKQLVEICVAHFRNHEGYVMPPAGVANLANGIRSRRAARQEAADWNFENKKRRDNDWVKAQFPEVKQ